MQVLYSPERKRFEAVTTYAEKDLVKGAGLRWDPTARIWWTDQIDRAARLAPYADETCKAELLARKAAQDATREASRATDAAVEVPVPEGLSYLPFQRAGIAFAMDRPATLLADQMGLGKTIQALGLMNADPEIRRVLILCPASLKLNWKREAEKWLVRPFQVRVGPSSPGMAESEFLAKETPTILILNYDVLHRWKPLLDATPFDLLVSDEAHYLKSGDARRTQMVVGKIAKKGAEWVWTTKPIEAKRRLLLTGTPIVNRPAELWSLIHYLDPQEWRSRKGYLDRYCDAHWNGYGYDYSGAAHLDELQDRLRSSLMIRRLKEEVLTELPAKRRQVIELPANGAAKAIAAERDAWNAHQDAMRELKARVELAKASDDPEEYEEAVRRLRAGARAAFTEISRVRHEVALAKVPYVIEHVTEALLEGPVILFAHHHDVIKALHEAFPDTSVVLTGETSQTARQEAVDRFQTDESVNLFIGSLTAAGVGLTLTRSAHVVFAELDWVPGNVTQGEDRAHRIGQVNSVLVQHLVLEGSLDAVMANTLVRKQSVIDAALDDAAELDLPLFPENRPEQAATEGVSRKAVEKEAPQFGPARVEAIHLGLRMLAGVCDGAHSLDGAGFNRLDTAIGKSLAAAPLLSQKQAVLGAKLVNKYRRQLPAEVVAGAKGAEEG